MSTMHTHKGPAVVEEQKKEKLFFSFIFRIFEIPNPYYPMGTLGVFLATVKYNENETHGCRRPKLQCSLPAEHGLELGTRCRAP